MRMKTFSKFMAIALTAVMTTCMTSCEDQRDIPVYGTGLESDTGVHHQIVTEPRYEQPSEVTQGADFMLVNAVIEQGSDGYEYLVLYTGVTNLTNETRSFNELVGVTAWYPNGYSLYYMREPVGEYNLDNLETKIDPGTQHLAIYAYRILPEDVEFITITTYDVMSEELIFETNIYLETK